MRQSRAEYIQQLVSEALTSSASVGAANRVLQGVKQWSGLSVGARPLSLDVQLPEAYVAKILALIARQGFLVSTPYENVYKFNGAKFPIQHADHIDSQGVVIRTPEGQGEPDIWRGRRY